MVANQVGLGSTIRQHISRLKGQRLTKMVKEGYAEIPSNEWKSDNQAIYSWDTDGDQGLNEEPCCSPGSSGYRACAFLMTLLRTLCTGLSMLSAQMLIGRIPPCELNIIRTLAPSVVYIVYYMLTCQLPSIGWRYGCLIDIFLQ